jgi:PAS domain S-box-containing protein
VNDEDETKRRSGDDSGAAQESVTGLYESGEAFKKATSDLQLIFKNMINAFVVWESVFDEQGNYVSIRFGYFNDAYARMAKFKLKDVQGKDVFEVWPETDKRWVDTYREVATTGVPRTFEMYHHPTTGTYHCNAYRPTDSPNWVCVIFEDITERKRADEVLRESEAKYRALIETTDTGFVILDGSGNVLDANAEYVRLAGYRTLDEIRGRSVREWTALHDAERNVREVKRCFEQGSIRNLRIDYVDRSGRFTPIEINATVISTETGLRIVTLCRDVSDRMRAEQEKTTLESQLLQSQKMESIGGLAGGIAHDFNNILTAIIGYASLLQMDMDKNDPQRIYVDQILASGQKAASLTQSLLAFSRKQVMELKPVDVNCLVREMEKILGRLLTEDIELKIVLSRDDVTVMADSTQLDQVLLNLATNARDAMPKGGKLIIGATGVILDADFQRAHGYGEQGEYAVISVTDTGCGMDGRTRERIFEPFFTTKETGKGTGLGLSMVYGIIKQHNGYIDVTSEQGVGTVFRIYLPAVKTHVEPTKQAGRAVRGGKETILVAEDNHELRKLIKEVLARKGYTVLEAGDGEEALRVFEIHREQIDLLVLDVVMPRRNGREVYEEVLRTTPDAKVLFTSGYTGDVILDKGIHDETVNFISKPLFPDDLLRKVREVLDR